MWGSGVVRRRRHVALAEMVAAAGRMDSYAQPWRLTPRIWEHFRDEASILEELQRDWRTALAGEVYVAIEAGEGDLQADVLKAFTTVSRRHTHARRILEAHADHPAIAAAMRKERALLASFGTLVEAASQTALTADASAAA
jgi:hypothetical protein